jgi:isocitrate dehydrogenase kinase/phosphatase
MVMLVFDLPSFPFVFKVIKDFYPPQKDTTREQIKGKYLLVKQHDRVGRMADTLEYSEVAFPVRPLRDELVAEIRSSPQPAGDLRPRRRWPDRVIIKHLYIERRMIPLNIYLQEPSTPGPAPRRWRACAQEQIGAVIEYGNAIKDLVAANIFPGDMLWKNFGVTRHGKVVFYDYDEIEYITDCNFRRVPAPRNEEDEMSGEIWYSVGPRTCSPRPSAPSCWATRRARGVHEAPRRPAGRGVLAEPQGAHRGPCATCSPTTSAAACPRIRSVFFPHFT